MLADYNPGDYETVTTKHICKFHKLNPGQPHPGCSCSISFAQQRKADTTPTGPPPENQNITINEKLNHIINLLQSITGNQIFNPGAHRPNIKPIEIPDQSA